MEKTEKQILEETQHYYGQVLKTTPISKPTRAVTLKLWIPL